MIDIVNNCHELNKLKEVTNKYNLFVNEYNKQEKFTNPQEYKNGDDFKFLVYSTANHIISPDKEFFRKNVLSVSYITNHAFGTYHGDFGLIYPYQNIISAYPSDIYSDTGYVNGKNEIAQEDFSAPSIIMPLSYIEEENEKKSIEKSGHLLDDTIYNELLIDQSVKPIGVYYMDYGMGKNCRSYEEAIKMANLWGFKEPVSIQKNYYRTKNGVTGPTLFEQYKIVYDLIDIARENHIDEWHFKGPDRDNYAKGTDESCYYEVYDLYQSLKNANELNEENIVEGMKRIGLELKGRQI